MEKLDVQSLFDAIAYRYDLLNHLLSGGIDLYWRRRAIESLRPLHPRRILDVATGTADFALAALRTGAEEIIGVDIAEEMLRRGRRKIERRGAARKVQLLSGEAERLAFPTGSFDAAIVAFGARNFENLGLGLAEMHRVLRVGGRIVVLEFSRPRRSPARQLYLFYFRRILPFLGRILSGHAHAYTYLPESVMAFPDGEAFLTVLETAGFKEARGKPLTWGIATVYTAIK